jgi:hypothetical protein
VDVYCGVEDSVSRVSYVEMTVGASLSLLIVKLYISLQLYNLSLDSVIGAFDGPLEVLCELAQRF